MADRIMTPTPDQTELVKILKDYRSKVANLTQQYWDDAATGVDTGVTTELLNKIDEEALAAISKLTVGARIEELAACVEYLQRYGHPRYAAFDERLAKLKKGI